MNYPSDEQIIERYKQLPGDLRKAVFSVDMAGAINDIGVRYKLAIDKIGALANETGMVMLGVTKPKDFAPNLRRRLGVDADVAQKIALEVNSRIFLNVRESMKRLHGGEEIETPVGETPSVDGKTLGVKETGEVKKEDILKVLEHPELPAVFSGTNKPEETQNLFEVKMKEEPPRAPMEETKHDPYREPIE